MGWGGGWGGLGWGVKVVTSLFQGPWKANTQVNSERKLTQFFSLQVEAMRVVLSHTLRMEFTVQLFNRRSMYCVDMFPKIMLQGGWGGVQWGGIIAFIWLATNTVCFASASLSCTSACTPCYATASLSNASAHTSCYATASFSYTSAHTSCYATASFSYT